MRRCAARQLPVFTVAIARMHQRGAVRSRRGAEPRHRAVLCALPRRVELARVQRHAARLPCTLVESELLTAQSAASGTVRTAIAVSAHEPVTRWRRCRVDHHAIDRCVRVHVGCVDARIRTLRSSIPPERRVQRRRRTCIARPRTRGYGAAPVTVRRRFRGGECVVGGRRVDATEGTRREHRKCERKVDLHTACLPCESARSASEFDPYSFLCASRRGTTQRTLR